MRSARAEKIHRAPPSPLPFWLVLPRQLGSFRLGADGSQPDAPGTLAEVEAGQSSQAWRDKGWQESEHDMNSTH